MGYARKVALNTGVQVVGKIAGTVLSLYTINLMTRYLGVVNYGAYTTAFAYVAFWSIFADFGVVLTLTQQLSQNMERKSRIFSSIFTLRFIVGATVMVLAAVAGLFLNYDLTTKLGIFVLAAAMFFQIVNMSFVSLFQAHFRMDKAAISEIVGRAGILAGILAVVRLDYGFFAVLGAYIAGNLLNFLLSYIFSLRFAKLKFLVDWTYWKRVLRLAIPIGLMSFFGYLYFRSDMLILSFMKSNFDVGIYGPTYKIFDLVVTIPGFVTGAAFPAITYLVVNDKVRLKGALQKLFDFFIVVGLPIGAAGFVLAEPIFKFVVSDKAFLVRHIAVGPYMVGGVLALKLLMAAIVIVFINAIFGMAIISASQQKRLVVPAIVYALFNISFNLIFIPRFSYIAASFSTFLTELLIVMVNLYLFKKVFGFLVSFRLLPKTVLATFCMLGSIYLFSGLHILAVIFIASVVYLLAAYLLKLISPEIIKEIFVKKVETNEG